MKVVLMNGTERVIIAPEIKEVTVDIFGTTIVIVLHSGEVLLAKSLTAKERKG